MKLRQNLTCLVVVLGMTAAPVEASAQMQFLGGAIGAAMGGERGVGGAVAGAIIGVALGTILQQLTAQERSQRQASLQRAARSGSASWSTKGKKGKRATYKKVGAVQSVGGRKCQMVRETITLPDGKRGTSQENVCFS